MVNLNGERRRARYSTSEALPDAFLRKALEGLTVMTKSNTPAN